MSEISPQALIDFVYAEARLLDEQRYEQWLDLFTEDLVYWMPTRSNRLRKDIANEIAQPDRERVDGLLGLVLGVA